MQNKNKRALIIGMVLILSTILISNYFLMPTLNIRFYGIYFITFLLGIFLLGLSIYVMPKEKKYGFDEYHKNNHRKKLKYPLFLGSFIVIITSLMMLTIIPFLLSTPMLWNADQYRNLIGEVKEKSFQNSNLTISLSNIRVVDEKTAKKLGDKKLGEDLGLGSRVEIGKYHIQKVKNELYWIAPLEYKSFFKWLSDDDGIEGYIMVSAQNSRNVQLVRNIDGKKIHMKYLLSAYGYEYIKRYVYNNGFNDIGVCDYIFEVDDNLNPFYVVTLYEKTIGFEGSNVIGVLTIDVQSGAIKKYDLNELPKWIDRVQPESFIKEQLNDWGKYVHGWKNSLGIFEQLDVIKLTDGGKLVYANDNNAYWYSGVTSVGSDDSIIGFLLTNSRTKETFFYKQSGATEKAAMRSAEGKTQEKEYNATFPSLYNIANTPTYVLSLKDNEGLVKMFAMISVEKYEIVGTGVTLKDALRDYKSLLNSNNASLNINSKAKLEKIEGIISRFNSNIRKGDSYYYLTIQNSKLIFIGSSNISDELPITKNGDKVSITYMKQNVDVKIINLVTFDNLNL